MSLRTRLFLFFGGLVSLLVGAEWALVTALTDDLEQEVGDVAFEVGTDVLGFFLPRVVTEDDRALVHAGSGRILERHPDLDVVHLAGDPERQRTFLFSDSDVEDTWFGEPVQVEKPRVHFRQLVTHVHEGQGHEGSAQVIVRQHSVGVGHPPRPGQRAVVAAGRPDRAHQVLRIVLSQNAPLVLGEASDMGVLVDLSGDFEIRTEGLGEAVSGIVSLELAEASRGVFFEDDEEHDVAWTFDGPPRPDGARVRPAGGRGTLAAVDRTPPADGGAEEAPDPTATPAANEPLAHEIPIPRDGVDTAVEGFLRRLWLGSIAIFGLGLVVAGYVAHRVTVPLRQLSRAAREVGDGALGTQVLPRGDREVAETLAAFNQMSTRLADLDAEARVLREREHLTEMGEVARGLAHAMRNPLHLLGLAVDELAQRGGDGATPLAGSARGQIQRIDRSLRSFLSLSAGGGAVEPVDVVDLARDVALELLQDEGGVPVRVEAEGTCRVAAVAPELRAVLHVLVVNAVEASPAGAEVTVRVACEEGGQVRFTVTDRGPGLPETVRGRLFTPHLTTKEQGAGMGLYLAHKIATTGYGGSLALADREGGGTVATLVVRDRRGIVRG